MFSFLYFTVCNIVFYCVIFYYKGEYFIIKENANKEDSNERNCVALHLELMFKQHYVATLINSVVTKEGILCYTF